MRVAKFLHLTVLHLTLLHLAIMLICVAAMVTAARGLGETVHRVVPVRILLNLAQETGDRA